ncbi:hypothetical protein GUJ93_ZPchr0013g34589 [Zizania palustris]|uniref:Uncharacterized protein n=1 Tax=Zizania palustris TaxID=103762 RepID=A0A8J6BUE9_ZIZPA|nr:hypothetical protein GUJ93_ZPchr0013g34589 [Zizania palustris]
MPHTRHIYAARLCRGGSASHARTAPRLVCIMPALDLRSHTPDLLYTVSRHTLLLFLDWFWIEGGQKPRGKCTFHLSDTWGTLVCILGSRASRCLTTPDRSSAKATPRRRLNKYA